MQQALDYPKEGEMVILYGSRDNILPCILMPSGVCRTRLGNFTHADILKTPIGHKVTVQMFTASWLSLMGPPLCCLGIPRLGCHLSLAG